MKAPWTGGSSPGSDRPSVDGNWTIADSVAEPETSFPFDSDSHAPATNSFTYSPELDSYLSDTPNPDQNNFRTDCFIIEQEFEVAADFFEPLALDTLYDRAQYAPDYAGTLPLEEAILIGESVPRNVGNGIVRWTRTYCRMPNVNLIDNGVFSRNTYESDTFSFCGVLPASIWLPEFQGLQFLGFTQTILGDGRPPMPAREVTVRVQKDYFLAPAGDFSPDLFDSTLPNFIYQKFTIYGAFIWQELESVFDEGDLGTSDYVDATGTSTPSPFTVTSPPKNDNPDTGEYGYLTAIADGWEIVCRQSVIRPWRGNIYERTTSFTIAQ